MDEEQTPKRHKASEEDTGATTVEANSEVANDAPEGDSMNFLTGSNSGKPECRIIVHNIGKKNNIGNIVRSAVAFGVTQTILCGEKKISTHGHQNTRKYMRFEHFPSLATCRTHLKEAGFSIVGVEIGDSSRDVTTQPFSGSTAFIFGNEGSGLHATAAAICDAFVYIPQYTPGTASLNVSIAASIVLHHFALWAKYTPNVWVQQKFVVDQGQQVEQFMFESSLAHKARIKERQDKRDENKESQSDEDVAE